MMHAFRTILLGMLIAVAAGCTYASGDELVFVSSTPAGARILVDGEDTGYTTPQALDLGGLFGGGDHTLTLELAGHEPESRQVVHHRTWASSRWDDGTDFRVFPLPLHWTLGDWFTPLEVHWGYVPGDLHVRLYPLGQAPVRAEQTQ